MNHSFATLGSSFWTIPVLNPLDFHICGTDILYMTILTVSAILALALIRAYYQPRLRSARARQAHSRDCSYLLTRRRPLYVMSGSGGTLPDSYQWTD